MYKRQAIGYNDNVGLKHDIEVDVEQGDIISFRVDEGMNNAYDTDVYKRQATMTWIMCDRH